jgi:Zn-dependent protease with chaperone function
MDDAPEVKANWYDGCSALRHAGTAQWDGGDCLVLRGSAGTILTVPLAELRFQEMRPDALSYRLADEPDFRLLLPRELPASLAAVLPARYEYGRWVDRLGLGRAVAIFTVASAAALALFFTAPSWLGPMIPESWERRMGDAMVGDLGNRVCHTPAGDAALARLASRIDPGGAPIRVGVANIGLVNAAALPGQQVILFDGLVQNAESADELAGVLAHEIGHVRERHVMTAMLRQFGLSILASGMSSGVGGDALGLISLDYSREAESQADGYARARLAAADISPGGTARFFERAGKEEHAPGWVSWIDSHPSPAGRGRSFRQAVRAGHAYVPALSPAEFAAIKRMCKEDPDVEEFDLF